MTEHHEIGVLIPTCDRPGALAVTLTALFGQSFDAFSIVISDQSEGESAFDAPEVKTLLCILSAKGHEVRNGRAARLFALKGAFAVLPVPRR